MRNKKMWVFVLVVCIMTLTSYANGRFVEWEEGTGDEIKYCLLEAGAVQRGCQP